MKYVLKQLLPNEVDKPIIIHITTDEFPFGRKTLIPLSRYNLISRLHAVFHTADSGELFIKDLSLNGVYVNDTKIGTSLHLLKIGDVIGFGHPSLDVQGSFVCCLCVEDPPNVVKHEVIDLTNEDDDVPSVDILPGKAACVETFVKEENKSKHIEPIFKEAAVGNSLLNATAACDLNQVSSYKSCSSGVSDSNVVTNSSGFCFPTENDKTHSKLSYNSASNENATETSNNFAENHSVERAKHFNSFVIPLARCDSKYFQCPSGVEKPNHENLINQCEKNSLADAHNNNDKKNIKFNFDPSNDLQKTISSFDSVNFHQNSVLTSEEISKEGNNTEDSKAINYTKRKISTGDLDKKQLDAKKSRFSYDTVKVIGNQNKEKDQSVSVNLMTNDSKKIDDDLEDLPDIEVCYSQAEEIIYISDDESYLDFNSQNCTYIKTEPLDLSDDENINDEICREIFYGSEPDPLLNTNAVNSVQNETVDDKVESIESIKAFVNAPEEATSEIISTNFNEATTFQPYTLSHIHSAKYSFSKNNLGDTTESLNAQSSANKSIEKSLADKNIEIKNNHEICSVSAQSSSKNVRKSSGKILLTDPKPIAYRPRKLRGREEGFKEQVKFVDTHQIISEAKVVKPNKSSTSEKKKSCSNLKQPSVKTQASNSNLKRFKIPRKSDLQNHADKSGNLKEKNSSNNVSVPNTSQDVDIIKTSTKKTSVKTRPEKFGSRMGFLLNDIEINPKNCKQTVSNSKECCKTLNNHKSSTKNNYSKSTYQHESNKALIQNASVTKCNGQIINEKYGNKMSEVRDPRCNKAENVLHRKRSDIRQMQANSNSANNIPNIAFNVSTAISTVLEKKSFTSKDTHAVSFDLSSLGLIKTLIKMNPLWLKEQQDHNSPPLEVKKGAADLPLHFTSYNSYVASFYPMIMLEVWENLRVESKPVYESKKIVNKFYFSVLDCISHDDCNELKCESIVNEKESFSPREGFIVILELKEKNCRYPCFGYIYKHKIEGLNMSNMIKKWKQLPSKWLTSAKRWVFFVYIKKKSRNYEHQSLMKGNGICYIKSKARLADALCSLQNSPLLNDILNPSPSAFSVNYSEASPTREYTSCQMKVIRGICAEIAKPSLKPKIILVQGPPGTGKTHTIIGLIDKLVFGNKCNMKILVAAPSNAAVDEIGSRLIELNEQSSWRDSSIKFVRVGLEKQISSKMKKYFLDKKARDLYQQTMYTTTLQKDRDLRNLKAEIAKLEKECDNSDRLKYLKDHYRQLKDQSTNKKIDFYTEIPYKINILKDSQIILSTLNSCGLSILQKAFKVSCNMQFSCCIIDESTQCTELDILQPLVFGMKKLLLVGDHEQLPATVLSKTACHYGLERSLFERLHLFFEMYHKQSPVFTLTEQFRMHSEICHFPSKHFYGQKLITDPDTDIRYALFPLQPYIVLDILGSQETNNQSSKFNCNEASVIVNICKCLLSTNLSPSSIGIITPYQAQRSLYMQALFQNPHYKDIEVNTVDGFQGREKEVIIFSSVRANSSSGSIGFLACKRRLNVSITRAKRCLIICTHTISLMFDEDWRALICDARDRNLCFTVTSPKDIPLVFDRYIHKRN